MLHIHFPCIQINSSRHTGIVHSRAKFGAGWAVDEHDKKLFWSWVAALLNCFGVYKTEVCRFLGDSVWEGSILLFLKIYPGGSHTGCYYPATWERRCSTQKKGMYYRQYCSQRHHRDASESSLRLDNKDECGAKADCHRLSAFCWLVSWSLWWLSEADCDGCYVGCWPVWRIWFKKVWVKLFRNLQLIGRFWFKKKMSLGGAIFGPG